MTSRKHRRKSVERRTRETDISISLDLDGAGDVNIDLPLGFLGHMLQAMSGHGLFDLELKGRGDLDVDPHHLTEDLGLVLGEALSGALGSKTGIRRFGFASVPMDESLVETSIDISGRPFLHLELPRLPKREGYFHFSDAREFMKSFVQTSGLTMHAVCRRGFDHHHVMEALFKSVGLALREAVSIERRQAGRVPSTKGVL